MYGNNKNIFILIRGCRIQWPLEEVPRNGGGLVAELRGAEVGDGGRRLAELVVMGEV